MKILIKFKRNIDVNFHFFFRSVFCIFDYMNLIKKKIHFINMVFLEKIVENRN